MMRVLLLISGFLMTFLAGLLSIWQIRGHFRTGLKTYLYWGISLLLGAFTILGLTIWGMSSNFLRGYLEDFIIVVMAVLYATVLILHFSGDAILVNEESGLWQQIVEKTTNWQRITGNVPILKHEKPPPLSISKRTGLILGISAMTLGIVAIIPFIFFKFPIVFMSFFIAAIVAFILGLLLVIFSIICLDNAKKPPE